MPALLKLGAYMRIEEGRKVVKLADYRKKKSSSTAQQPEKTENDRVLDEVSYHLVMAARAIAAQRRTH